MLRHTLVLTVAFTSFAAISANRADATVVRALTLEEKCRVAPLIVYGAVERIESEWEVPEASARTLITVRVIQTLKGDAKAETRLIVYQGGGQIGGFKQVAPGMSKYEPGEEVVLFLEPTGPYLVEIGIGIGKYAIENNWVTHAPNVAGARIEKGKRMEIQPIEPMKPMQLDLFLKRIRSHVAGIPVDPPFARKGASLRKLELPKMEDRR